MTSAGHIFFRVRLEWQMPQRGGHLDLLIRLALAGHELSVRAKVRPDNQNSALPGVRAKGITSRMFATPVTNMSMRSKPRPKPAWGTVP